MVHKIKEEGCINRLASGKTAVITCIIIVTVFILVLNLCDSITDWLIPGGTLILKKTVSEGLLAAFALFLLKCTAGFKKMHGGDFTRFKRIGKMPLLPGLVFAVIIQLIRAFYGHNLAEIRPLGEIFLFAFLVLFIGIAEEAVFRGVIAESMLCTFGADEEGRHFAALVSGIIFGMAHLQNMIGADVTGVLVQSVGASVVGILFTEVYYSFRSLKPVIILHAGIDFLAMLEFGMFEGVYITQIVSKYSLWMIIPYAIIFMTWIGYCNSHNRKRVCA